MRVDQEQRIASSVGIELMRAYAAVEEVTRLLEDPDAPWHPLQVALFQERCGGILGDLKHMSRRAAETGQALS